MDIEKILEMIYFYHMREDVPHNEKSKINQIQVGHSYDQVVQ